MNRKNYIQVIFDHKKENCCIVIKTCSKNIVLVIVNLPIGLFILISLIMFSLIVLKIKCKLILTTTIYKLGEHCMLQDFRPWVPLNLVAAIFLCQLGRLIIVYFEHLICT